MSFGMFDDLETSQTEAQRREASADQDLKRAIVAVRDRFGDFFSAAEDRDDFRARVALVKNDMIHTIADHTMPLPGVVRRVQAAVRPDFSPAPARKRQAADADDVYDDIQSGGLDDEDLGELRPPAEREARRKVAAEVTVVKKFVLLDADDPEGSAETLKGCVSEIEEAIEEVTARRRTALDFENTDSWTGDVMDAISVPDGGFTMRDQIGDAPSVGYMVSDDKGHEGRYPLADVTPDVLTEYVNKYRDRFDEPDRYFGGWVEVEDEVPHVYLDVPRRIEDLAEAGGVARSADQISIYDLSAGDDDGTIYTEDIDGLLGSESLEEAIREYRKNLHLRRQASRREADIPEQYQIGGDLLDAAGDVLGDMGIPGVGGPTGDEPGGGEDPMDLPDLSPYTASEGKPLIPQPTNEYLSLPADDVKEHVFDGPVVEDGDIVEYKEAGRRPFRQGR